MFTNYFRVSFQASLAFVLWLAPFDSFGARSEAWPSARDERKLKQEIHFTTGSPPPSFDPSLSSSVVTQFWASYLFEGLMRWNKKGQAVSGAAQEVIQSLDGKTVTFKLRPNLRWHDDKPLVAQHFVDAFRRLVNPAVASENSYLVAMAGIHNAGLVESGKLPLEALGVSAPNAQTVVLQLDMPVPFLMEMLATSPFSPSRADLTQKTAQGEPYQSAERIVGNGPFKLTVFQNQARIRLEKSAEYWDASSIKLSALEMPVATEAALSSVRLLQAGQLDVVWGIQAEAQALVAKMGMKMVPFRSGAVWYLLPNMKPGRPFENKILRQQLAGIMDRNEHVFKILGTAQALPTKFFVPSFLRTGALLKPEAYSFKQQAADKKNPVDKNPSVKNLAGRPEKIGLLTGDSPSGKMESEYLQSRIQKFLNVRVQVELAQSSVRIARIVKGDFDLAVAASVPSYPDANSLLEEFLSESSANVTGYRSAEFDKLMGLAKKTLDPLARSKLLVQAERILLLDVAVIPINESGNILVSPPDLMGVGSLVFGANPDFRFAYWKSAAPNTKKPK